MGEPRWGRVFMARVILTAALVAVLLVARWIWGLEGVVLVLAVIVVSEYVDGIIKEAVSKARIKKR